MTWPVEHQRGSAADFHAREVPEPLERRVWVFEADRPALVIGSAQPETDADADAMREASVELVRRRSGGGAVLLVPGEHLWLDVLVPRADPLWDDDVGAASHWVGEVWAAAMRGLGLSATVHRGRYERNEWSGTVCFAGLGPGEVTAGGRKLVGVSQRRSRAGARFQCVVLGRWDPAALVSLLALDDETRAAATDALTGAAAAVDVPLDAVETAFLAALP